MKSPQLPGLTLLTCVLALAGVACSSVDTDPAGGASSAVRRGRDAEDAGEAAAEADGGTDEGDDDDDGGPRHHHHRRHHPRHHHRQFRHDHGNGHVLSFDGDCNKR